MGLINLQTNLKSLKYGKDRIGGGDSGQPFIKTSIDTNQNQFGSSNTDFLLRGGIQAPLRALEDVVRLTKYIANPKSPSGLLFVAKQNILSRTSVSPNGADRIFNDGVYTPLSTLSQAGVGFAGIHFRKQGIDPTGTISSLSPETYSSILDTQILKDKSENNNIEKSTNRLITFLEGKQNTKKISDILDSYSGGPGSILGVGKTEIKFADKRTGVNSPTYKNNFRGGSNRELGYNLENIFIGVRGNFSTSLLYSKLTGTPQEGLFGVDFFQNYNGKPTLPQDSNNVYTPFTAGTFPENTPLIGKGSWTQQDFIDQPKNLTNEVLEDFRTKLNPTESPQNTFLSISPNYTGTDAKNIESRVNLGDPGKKGNISNYTIGKRGMGVDGSKNGPLDKITALPIYRSETVTPDFKVKNDLVKFRIAIIDPTSQGAKEKTFIHFRAFINSFSDSYKANWKGQKYMGRAEEFYKYDGFGRDISIDFTVAAQSKEELIPMYRKLNFLASSLAPSYTNSGYMAGNMSQMTVGGYLFEQPGIIESVNYEIPTESPWEIAIPVQQEGGENFENSKLKELPHIINVSIKFTPIHKFRPAIMDVKGNKNTTGMLDNNKYGNEKYIALSDGAEDDGYFYKFDALGTPIDHTTPTPTPPTLPTSQDIVEITPEVFTQDQIDSFT